MLSSHICFNDDDEIVPPTGSLTTVARAAATAAARVRISDVGVTQMQSTSSDKESDEEVSEEENNGDPNWDSGTEDTNDDDDDDGTDDNGEATDDDDDEDDAITSKCKKTHQQYSTLVDMSVHVKLRKHMMVGNDVPLPEFTTLVGRVSKFIGWIMLTEKVSQALATARMFSTPSVFIRYVLVLRGDLHLKAGTVYNILLDFIRFAKYMAVFEQTDTVTALILFENQLKVFSKKKKHDVHSRGDIDALTLAKRWPPGGKRELYDIMLKCKPAVEEILQQGVDGDSLSRGDLTAANDFCVTMLFIGNPQSRSKALTRMSVDSLPELKREHCVMSTEFKTRRSFGYQPIHCNDESYAYLEAYVTYIRPLLLGSAHCNTLFVNGNQSSFKDVGFCLTRFFKANSEYHITTTSLRSMFETEADAAMRDGKLTPAEVANVTRNNQHSAATSRAYYLKTAAAESGKEAVSVHDKLYSTGTKLASPVVRRSDDEPYTPTSLKDD